MNLFDLVKRPDRSVEWLDGDGEACSLKWPGGTQRGVRFKSIAKLRLKNAHEFTSLRTRPMDPGWRFASEGGNSTLNIDIVAADGERRSLVEVASSLHEAPKPVALQWPVERRFAEHFNIEICVSASGAVAVGPQIDMRRSVVSLAKGIGVEVGPGLSPSIVPGDGVDVTYVEAKLPEDWSRTYAKTSLQTVELPEELRRRYVIGSAVSLDHIPPGSLDFIFSNHVFEHLQNPVRVLRNWLRVLKPGGVIAGVTPDARFTFDCRQPVTTLADALREAESLGHQIPIEKFERWSRWTAPESTPASLIARNYSIHVSFFTPETFAAMGDFLKKENELSAVCIVAAANNKDFSFALWKP